MVTFHNAGHTGGVYLAYPTALLFRAKALLPGDTQKRESMVTRLN